MARFTIKRKAFSCSKAEYKRDGNKFSIKRKTFGVVEAGQNILGGAMETAGNIADTKIGGLAGGVAGGSLLGGTIAGALPALGFAAGPVGWLIGAGLGAAATRAAGKGLKSVGESIKAD